MNQKEWFASWFDTEYYHLLYQDRDFGEAAAFIVQLCEHLDLPQRGQVLDLACGKGRHSVTLHEQGFDVLGADLSSNSIKKAEKRATEGLEFIVHDMREVIPNKQFDAVFNLFTSFGYFDTQLENETVLSAVHEMIRPGGKLIIDFMNASKVIRNLEASKQIKRGNISFDVSKKFEGGHIYKDIRFEDKGTEYHFSERVQAITLDQFQSLLTATGFEILSTFGDFELRPFDEENSDRLILLAKKH